MKDFPKQCGSFPASLRGREGQISSLLKMNLFPAVLGRKVVSSLLGSTLQDPVE